jgi:hypothetical protein
MVGLGGTSGSATSGTGAYHDDRYEQEDVGNGCCSGLRKKRRSAVQAAASKEGVLMELRSRGERAQRYECNRRLYLPIVKV